jgi:hypothetical protein
MRDVLTALQGARHLVGCGQHLLDQRDAFLTVLPRAAGVLDVEHLERVAFAQAAVRPARR